MPSSALSARRLVRIALTNWRLEQSIDDAELIVSELVSNAVRHTSSRVIRVTAAWPMDTRVRIGVIDRSRTIPHLQYTDRDYTRPHGRGLLMIDALTYRWGTDLYNWGKMVWGDLLVEARP
ncbi:ATP-binding protein [Streptomyces ortus]|uniref:ATP-binding protein n=1 Tax=Streptomyces ortus TaxID=2867268 RepID=A0ABT3UYX5_9ACTN|nr:ATP-binding protein [Streptomyces ortus]MCX4232793.1 ATP-binding protein [Streptomyces ortus]